MNRRELLCTTATAMIGTVSGCIWATDRSPEEEDTNPSTMSDDNELTPTEEPRFETVINLVEEGADDTGDVPIDDVVHEHLNDDTLLVLDEGVFRIEQLIVDGYSNFGIVSAEGATPTLVPAETIDERGEYWLVFHGENVRFGGFEYDFTKERISGRTQVIAERGGIEVFDIHVRGHVLGENPFRFGVRDPDGTGYVRKVVARDGGQSGDRLSGIFVGVEHAGAIHIVDCEMWHFPSKGIYASNPGEDVPDAGGGTVHVEGGVYKNNNAAQIRIGSEGSTVRDVEFVTEDTLSGENVTWAEPIPLLPPNDHLNTRGLRLRGGGNVLVEGCTFDYEIGAGDGVLTVEGSHGDSTVRDCRIRSNADELTPVRMKESSKPMTFESVEVVGSGSGAPAVRMVGREGTTFRNCTIESSGSETNGIEIVRSNRCVFDDTSLKSTEFDIALFESGRKKDWTDRHRLLLDQNGTTKPVEYQVMVNGEILKWPASAELFGSKGITGTLEDGTISIVFSGHLTELDLEEPTTVVLEYFGGARGSL